MVKNLPNECLSEIFKHIDENDTKTLFSILQVNRLWCQNIVSILWENPFKPQIKSFKILLTLLSYYYNDNKEEPSIKYLKESNSIYIPKTSSTFNYPSFIKQLELTNILHMILSLVKKFNLNHSSIIQIIWNMITNNSKIETLIINTSNSYRILKPFKPFFKTSATKNCFSILKRLTLRLKSKDLSILDDLIECINGKVKEIELEISNNSNLTISNSYVINLIKSQKNLKKFIYKNLSGNIHIQPIIIELENHSHSMKILHLEQRCDLDVDLLSNLKNYYNLQELSLRNFHFEGNHELLSNIIFSQLKSLSLNWITSRNPAYISESIFNLIQNHAVNLKYLSIKTADIIMKDTSLCCSNLKSFSCLICDPSDMTFIYSIFKNNPHLTSIDLCITIPIRNSFLSKLAKEIPKSINKIVIGYSILGKENLGIFLRDLNCNRLKSFKFNWQPQKNVNIPEMVKNISETRGWTLKECEFALAQYQHIYILKWE
ncbi:hypothetical protein C1645_880422 [Glomus cerebriforme]|uniref:F-box domain-containing protein n=1 Tax=Glomus cerebriforme TaxID=658196 RepID=A0A397SH64_9GLOM|nr:hypothetical protein C1645_880422 [Glomus cerebriforme]